MHGQQNIKIKCVFWVSVQAWNISLSNRNSARYYHKCTYVFKWSTRYSCQILTWIYSTVFWKNSQISNFLTFLLVGGELLRADRQTDMTKLLLSLRNFANAPKNITHDIGPWAAILWSDLNNRKLTLHWELGRVRNCFMLGRSGVSSCGRMAVYWHWFDIFFNDALTQIYVGYVWDDGQWRTQEFCGGGGIE